MFDRYEKDKVRKISCVFTRGGPCKHPLERSHNSDYDFPPALLFACGCSWGFGVGGEEDCERKIVGHLTKKEFEAAIKLRNKYREDPDARWGGSCPEKWYPEKLLKQLYCASATYAAVS